MAHSSRFRAPKGWQEIVQTPGESAPEARARLFRGPGSSEEETRLRALTRFVAEGELGACSADAPASGLSAEMEVMARLAAQICGTSGAYVALLEEDRVRMLGGVGVQTASWPRFGSPDTWVACRDEYLEVFEVCDARHDPRFAARLTLEGGEGARFYAAAPLLAPGGHVLGTLAVADSVPRELSAAQRRSLADLARLCMDKLDLRLSRLRVSDFHVQRTRLENALRLTQHENSLLSAAVESAAIGVIISDPSLPDNPVIFVNPAFTAITGYAREEVMGRNCRFLQGAATSPNCVATIRRAIEAKQPARVNFINYRRDGTQFWNELSIDPVRDERGEVVAFVGVQSDVSARVESQNLLTHINEELEKSVQKRTVELQSEVAEHRRAREELHESRGELRALAARLESVQEAERTRIAREIHDELGQVLTHFKIQLALLNMQLVSEGLDPGEANRKIVVMTSDIDEAMASVRRIASDLRPSVLERFGLCEGLRWLANDFQSRLGLPCAVETGVDEPRVDAERATALFRIAQEALTNIARHASATRVEISLHAAGDWLVFEVRDNGHGIAQISPLNAEAPRRLGLVGIRERVSILGGQVSIGQIRPRASVRRGTRLRVKIPFERRRSDALVAPDR